MESCLRSRVRSSVRRLSVILPAAVIAAGYPVLAYAADPVLPHPPKTAAPAPGLGELSFSTFETMRLNDRTQLKVNTVNGNVILHAQDAEIRGTGITLSLERRYQSRSSSLTGLGYGWTASYGRDVTATPQGDGAVVVSGPQGYAVRFGKNGTGFDEAPGLKATLAERTGGGYTLTYKDTKQKVELGRRIDGTWVQTAETDRHDNTVTYAYDGQNRLASVTDTQGRVTRFAYLTDSGDFARLVRTITDPAGRVHRFVHDSHGDLVAYADPSGRVTGYSYNEYHDLTAVLSPEARLTRIGYDNVNRATAVGWVATHATYAGEVLPLVNDTCMPSSIVSPSLNDLLVTGDRCADAVRSAARTTGDAGTVYTRYTYALGNTVVHDARNNPTTYHYDNDGKVTKVVNAAGDTESKTYTPSGDVTTYTNALNSVTTLSYDTQGRLTSVQAPGTTGGTAGTKTTFGYDTGPSLHDNQPTSSTDAQGNTTQYAYDGKGNLATTTTPLTTQNQFKRTYNGNGTVDTATDAKGAVTRYSYDTKGNLTGITYPAPLAAVKMTMDGLSRLASYTDGKGQTTRYEYDYADRIVKVAYADGSGIAYTYDADGNLVKRVEPAGTTELQYDQRNQVVAQRDPDGGESKYGYDAVGNLTHMSDGVGGVSYTYDAVNNLVLLDAGDPSQFDFQFGYDKAGRRRSTSFPNLSASHVVDYDDGGRPTKITIRDYVSEVFRFDYSYANALGSNTMLRQSVTDIDGNKTAYTYDPMNRLTGARTTNTAGVVGSDYKYAYDGNGNKTSQTVGASTTTYAYNSANQLTSGGGVTYDYDANGNLTGSSNGYSYDYDARNHTTNVTTPNGVSTQMRYLDVTQKLRTQAGPTTFRNTILGVTSTKDTATGEETFYIRDNKGQLLGMRKGQDYYYFVWDATGSIVGVLNRQTGKFVNKYKYDPFGKTVSSTESVTNPWRFGGGYLDRTGQVKFGERYYDQGGRWTQQDPVPGTLTEPNRVNRYTYASNDPVNRVDPTGREDCAEAIFDYTTELIFSVGGGTAALVTAATAPPLAATFAAASLVFAVKAATDSGKDIQENC